MTGRQLLVAAAGHLSFGWRGGSQSVESFQCGDCVGLELLVDHLVLLECLGRRASGRRSGLLDFLVQRGIGGGLHFLEGSLERQYCQWAGGDSTCTLMLDGELQSGVLEFLALQRKRWPGSMELVDAFRLTLCGENHSSVSWRCWSCGSTATSKWLHVKGDQRCCGNGGHGQ